MATDIIARGIAAKALKQGTSNKQQIDLLSAGVHYKGVVDYEKDLPKDAELGDAYTVLYKGVEGNTPSGAEFIWGNYKGVNKWISFRVAQLPECPSSVEGDFELKASVAGGKVVYSWTEAPKKGLTYRLFHGNKSKK